MGCPAGQCAGYELTDNLAFATSATWTPIALPSRPIAQRYFRSTLDGAGHTITGLDVSVTSGGAGLFVALYNDATVRDLGLIAPTVNSDQTGSSRGTLAGFTYPGVLISGVYAAGGSVTGTSTGNTAGAGGLVGSVRLGTVQASYASVNVSIGGTAFTANSFGGAGGLVGRCRGCAIIASYATGAVTGTSPTALANAAFGGLAASTADNFGRASVITNSYCESQTGGPSACIGRQSGAAVTSTAYTTAQLQQPTGYTGIYLHWNIILDGDATPDHPWNFGASNEYPTLNTLAQRAIRPPATDYDANDNGLIDINSIAKLNALRWDLDGDGAPDTDTAAADYRLAFPNRDAATSTRMGCPAGQCAGYELTENLTFATSATWDPININLAFSPPKAFTATLDGAGYTITGLTSTSGRGLFGLLWSGATVRDLGLINATVTGSGSSSHGLLAGGTGSDTLLTGVYASGGSITITHTGSRGRTGGLVGRLEGRLYAAWSTAAVSVTGTASSIDDSPAGGLVGHCRACTLAASYAAGAVTSSVSNALVGGLVGEVFSSATAGASNLADSYCNPDAAGLTDCIGALTGAAATSTAYSAAQLQAPTGYTGIYQNWNIDLDLDARPDYPWNFGTSSTYPTLNTPAQRAALTPAPPATVDYDANDNGLIDIANRDQLHALRWDLDGNGDPEGGRFNAFDYLRAFPNRDPATSTRMGCPGGACTGYELTRNLTLLTAVDWDPIGNTRLTQIFNATLDGRGRNITGLTIEGAQRFNNGMFRALGGSSTVRNLNLVNGRVIVGGAAGSSGILAGIARPGALISAVSVGGSIRGQSSSTDPQAGIGGLVGRANGATIQASYGADIGVRLDGSSYSQTSTGGGGLVGQCLGCAITASYSVSTANRGIVASSANARVGGLVGYVESSPTYGTSTITDSYCYAVGTGGSNQIDCIGHQTGTPAVAAAAKTRAELREPTGYTGIYENWNLDLDGNGDPDDPWIFPGPPTGGHSHAWTYPSLRNPYAPAEDHDHEHDDDHDDEQDDHDDEHDDHDDEHDDDHDARPPADDSDYNPAADHPEIYTNDRYEMSVTCQVQRNAEGEPTGSTITFNLGSYEGEILLAMTLWNGHHFAGYENMDADPPTLNRDGQTATVQIITNPTQTRFLLDGRPHGLRMNLLLGYADCHTDDPGAQQPAPTPTPTPAPEPPKVYRSDQHEMTAACAVTRDANGHPTASQITFNLGDYQAEVTLHLSLWNGEYYATYEAHNLTQPDLERNNQTATVTITTDPTETVFLLNTANKPTRNLLLGHADCHTAR